MVSGLYVSTNLIPMMYMYKKFLFEINLTTGLKYNFYNTYINIKYERRR